MVREIPQEDDTRGATSSWIYLLSLFPAEVKRELPFLGLVIMAAAYCVGVMIPSP
jgi:hypothetical protein